MYKALNLKDKNSYVVFVVKNAYLLYFPLSFKSSWTLYIYWWYINNDASYTKVVYSAVAETFSSII